MISNSFQSLSDLLQNSESWLQWFLILVVAVCAWIAVVAIRAILGELFKRWYFRSREQKAEISAKALKERAAKIREREIALDVERLVLEGSILRRWAAQEVEIANRRSQKQNDAA